MWPPASAWVSKRRLDISSAVRRISNSLSVRSNPTTPSIAPRSVSKTFLAMPSRRWFSATLETNSLSSPNKLLATVQPLSSSPKRLPTGTRTFSRKTSFHKRLPLNATKGSTEIPGVERSISRKLMPFCGCTSGLLRTRQKIQSACSAPEVQIFCPSTTYSSPSRTARVPTDARSEPACGSE